MEYTKIFQKLIKNRFISFQLPFLAAKWSGVYENLPFWTSHISYGSKTWTLILKLKILKLVLDVLHFILLPLCGCFTNKFIIKSRKSLVVLNEVAFVFYLFSKIYKFSWILAIPFSLEEVTKGITPCVKVPWFLKLVIQLQLLTFTRPWPCEICLLYCKIWLLPPLELVKISFYHL